METGESEVTVDLSQALQPAKLEAQQHAGHTPIPQQQDMNTPIATDSALLQSMSDHVNRVSDVLPKQLTDILGSVSVTTDSSVSEVTFSTSQDLLTSTSVLQPPYISESYSPVISGQQLPLSSVADLMLPDPAAVKDQEPSPATVEDQSVSLQNLYSTVSHLHHMLMKNPQLFAKPLQYPSSSPVSVEQGQKDLSGDSRLISPYYAKTESEQEQSSPLSHGSLIQAQNTALYKYSDFGVDKADIVVGKASAAATAEYSHQLHIPQPSQDVLLATDKPNTSDSGQHLTDSQFDKDTNIPRPQINQIKSDEEIHLNQNQLKQFYHSDLINSSDVRLSSSKLTYAEPTVIEKHVVPQELDIGENLSKGSQSIPVQEKESPIASLPADPVDARCICDQLTDDDPGLPTGRRQSRKDHALSSRIYTCGGCSSKFSTICRLHSHLKEHASGGSYHFDHVSRTAFPKYDTFCSYSQTDLFDNRTEVLNSQETHESQASHAPVEAERISVPTIVTRRTRKQEDLVKETNKPATRSQSGRKRKQDHPKSTKPRIHLVPIVAKEKKLVKDKKPKRRGRGKKMEQKTKIVQGNQQDNAIDVSKSDENKDTVIVAEVYVGVDCLQEKSDNYQKEEDCIVVVNPEPAETDDDSSAMSKPFKKRGRSRKPVTEITKASTPKEMDKKTPATKTKKSKKQTDPADEKEQEVLDSDGAVTEAKDQSGLGEEEAADDMAEMEADDAVGTEVNAKRRKTGKPDQFQVCNQCGLTIPRYKYIHNIGFI